ncbi:MAG: ABC transporter permease [Planctomycetia bacterium]|nr:ABC transporter permease [Planctomycetia bacterium]
MSLFTIAWRSMWQRRLSTSLTCVSMALGVALVVGVLVVYGALNDTFLRSTQGFDLIVGAKGGQLQLVLNTVYHVSSPLFPIKYQYYLDLKENKLFRGAKVVDVAIPVCMGDNHQGYRVVGTVPELFDLEYADGKKHGFSSGRNMHPEGYFESVVGSVVARKCDPPLVVGSKFRPTHGFTEEGAKHDEFTVVGVLEHTGTPNDRAIFVNIEGFYLLEGHAADKQFRQMVSGASSGPSNQSNDPKKPNGEGTQNAPPEQPPNEEPKNSPPAASSSQPAASSSQPAGSSAAPAAPGTIKKLPIEDRDVTAILIRTNPDYPVAAMTMDRVINRGNVAQSVAPTKEIYNLFKKIVDPMRDVLVFLTVMIVVVSAIGVLVSILNSMNERKRDIAVMRALGASRGKVSVVILLESVLLSGLGGAIGFMLGHGVIAVLSPFIEDQTDITVSFLNLSVWEWVLVPGMIALATLVGVLPAQLAYRTDVSRALAASP